MTGKDLKDKLRATGTGENKLRLIPDSHDGDMRQLMIELRKAGEIPEPTFTKAWGILESEEPAKAPEPEAKPKAEPEAVEAKEDDAKPEHAKEQESNPTKSKRKPPTKKSQKTDQ